jgi:apolipoprotein D and lipocalin family protein
MQYSRANAALFTALLALAGCGSGSADTVRAPQPVKPIDTARFYSGRWYEIGRTPMSLTDGCVAGTTDYYTKPDGQLIDRDACRDGTPEGKEKVFEGPVKILNPGENNKVSVRYTVVGIVPVTRTYWMLDHGDDYGWFIVSDPALENVSIFTRAPRPPAELIDRLKGKVKAFGYDPARLEFPTRFPEGEK